MQQNKKTLFISDLHLDASHPEITSQFIQLLNSDPDTIDGLYILGDLFELWTGDDDDSELNQTVMSHLRQATQNGLKIHYMHGNRDFLIGEDFLSKTGCKQLPEEITIDLYGTPVLIMHGDTLCTRDVAYQRMRKFMQNRILQKIFLSLPLRLRRKIAAWTRNASEKSIQNKDLQIMDVTHKEVERVLEQHNARYLIHGHTHRSGIHDFMKNNQAMQRIVLPAWHNQGIVFEWHHDGRKNFIPVS